MTNRIRDIDWSQFELKFDAEENPIIILKRTQRPVPTHMINNRYLAICTGETNNLLFHRAVWFLNEIANGRVPDQNMEIHHIDENKLNNKLSNLEAISSYDHRVKHGTLEKARRAWQKKWNNDPEFRQWVIENARRACAIRVEKHKTDKNLD